MKNKRIAALFALTLCAAMLAGGCSFGRTDEEEVVDTAVTPTEAVEETPTPEPTVAPDVQDSTYTSSTGDVSIKLPDATWSNKADEEDLLSFESPDQGKILITHGQGEEDMSVAVIPDTQDLAVSLEQANEMTEGTDFEIQSYTAEDVSGIGVYTYVVKYLNTEASGGYAYAVNKIYAGTDEYYNLCGSVKDDASLSGIQAAVESFTILNDSSLKAAAGGSSADGTSQETTAADGTTQDGTSADAASTDGTVSDGSTSTDGTVSDGTASTDASVSDGTASSDSSSGGRAGYTAEQLTDTNQTRTIYTNDGAGTPRVITPNGDGTWSDSFGNTYRFDESESSTVYDQNDVSYYWHGEAGDVSYPLD